MLDNKMTAYEEHLVNNGWSPEEAAVMYQKFSDPTFSRDPEMMREYQPGFLSIPRRAQFGDAHPVTLAPTYTQRLMQASPAPTRIIPAIPSVTPKSSSVVRSRKPFQSPASEDSTKEIHLKDIPGGQYDTKTGTTYDPITGYFKTPSGETKIIPSENSDQMSVDVNTGPTIDDYRQAAALAWGGQNLDPLANSAILAKAEQQILKGLSPEAQRRATTMQAISDKAQQAYDPLTDPFVYNAKEYWPLPLSSRALAVAEEAASGVASRIGAARLRMTPQQYASSVRQAARQPNLNWRLDTPSIKINSGLDSIYPNMVYPSPNGLIKIPTPAPSTSSWAFYKW